jgi:Tfp pilus assembly protein PilX
MAFSNAVTKKGLLTGGRAFEEGTWNGASVTTGNITLDTTAGTNIVGKVEMWSVSSDGDTAVIAAQDAGVNILKLTFTSSDTGKYRIEGPAA